MSVKNEAPPPLPTGPKRIQPIRPDRSLTMDWSKNINGIPSTKRDSVPTPPKPAPSGGKNQKNG